MVGFYHLTSLPILLLLVGLWGIFVISFNLITILISLELLLLAASLNFIIFSIYLSDIVGQIFALLILTVAGAESAIGLAILLSFYRLRGEITISSLVSLKAS